MTHPGDIQNLTESRDQALQALLGSLAPGLGESSAQNGTKLSPQLVKKLSEKLGELAGDVESNDVGPNRNEKGEEQLLNEEGLPIIEVNEPLQDSEQPTIFEPKLAPDESDLVPLTSLSASEQERRRLEREAILDSLEQEEVAQKVKDEKSRRALNTEEARKRKESVQPDLERLKAAREMQKKMGKALLRNMADAREKEENAKREALQRDHTVEEQKKTLKAKKSVSFADLPTGGGEPKNRSKLRELETHLDWGDVAPARLRSAQRSTLMTKAQMDRQPMRLDVIERLPAVPSEPEEEAIRIADSDDESIYPSPVDSDEGELIQSDNDGAATPEDVPDSGSDDEEFEDDPTSDNEEFDLDTAHHHREIALEYYKKRTVLGEGASMAMMPHTHPVGEDEWNQADVPVEATLSSSKPKSSMSRFKAERVAPVPSPSSSTPFGPSILPGTSYQTLKRAIRTGHLEDDKLVGGEAGDSASEPEDDNAKEIFELLKRGQVHNIGATLPSDKNSPPSISASSRKPAQDVAGATQHAVQLEKPSSSAKSKPSVFKLNRTQGSRNSTGEASTIRSSSPKVVSTTASSSAVPSPSLPFSMIVDSPSFPPSTLVTSPAPNSSSSNHLHIQSNTPIASVRRPDRPPTVLSASVLESTGNKTSTGANRVDGKEKKVSRFLAERM